MSFQGLSVAVKTVRIVEELMEIWPNKVCNKKAIGPNELGLEKTFTSHRDYIV